MSKERELESHISSLSQSNAPAVYSTTSLSKTQFLTELRDEQAAWEALLDEIGEAVNDIRHERVLPADLSTCPPV